MLEQKVLFNIRNDAKAESERSTLIGRKAVLDMFPPDPHRIALALASRSNSAAGRSFNLLVDLAHQFLGQPRPNGKIPGPSH